MPEVYFPTEIRVGGESQLPSRDEYTFGTQITAMPDGNFLATWLDESAAGLSAQIIHANGHRLGSPVQIQPTNGRSITDWYDVAISESGEVWVVATQVSGESDFQVSISSFREEELLSGPAPEIAPIWYQLDANPDGAQITPSVTILDNGSAAVTWIDALQDNSGPFGFGAGSVNLNIMPSPSMTSTGAITVNNLNLSSGQFRTSVAALQNGNFVVVWDGVELGGAGQTIQFQILNENGIKVGVPQTVPAGNDFGPFGGQVAALSDGGFVVVWQSATSINGLSDVAYRVYSDEGNPVSSGIAHESIVGLQMDATVIATDTGGFIVGWTDASGVQDDPGTGSFARAFNAVGNPLTDAFLLNESTIGDQTTPQLAVSENQLAAVWQSYSDSTGEPIDTALFQVFNMRPEEITPGPQEVLAVSHDTDGDLFITQRGNNGPNSFIISELVKGDARIPIVNQSEIEFMSNDPDLVPVVFRNSSGQLGVWANGAVGSNVAIITDAETLSGLDGEVLDRSTFDQDYSTLPPNPDRTASVYDLPNGMQLKFEFKTEFGGRSIFTELQVLDEQSSILYAEPIIYQHLLPTDIAFGADDTVYILQDYPNAYGFIATVPLFDLDSVFYKSLERVIFGETPQSENWEEIVFRDDRLFVFVDGVDLEDRPGFVQLIQELDLEGNPVGRPFILDDPVDPDTSLEVLDDGALRLGLSVIEPVSVNTPPAVQPQGVNTIDAGQSLELKTIFDDPDGDVLSFAVVNAPDGAWIDRGGVLHVPTLPADSEITVLAYDGSGASVTLRLGVEADIRYLQGTSGPDLLAGDSGNDTLEGNDGNDTLEGKAGDDLLKGGSGNDAINAGFGFDLVYGGLDEDQVRGLNGFDTIRGNRGNDTLMGNAGNDVLYGGAGDDRVEGGIGFDEVHGDAGNDTLIGADGFDTLHGGGDADTLEGNAGNDSLMGDAGNDRLEGGIGFDTLLGGAGNDLLFGSAGFDLLSASAGEDRLLGNAGNDTLDGGADNDVLIGGIGVDTFVFGVGYGADRVADFQNAIDAIEIDAALLGGPTPVAADLIQFASRDGNGFLILDFGNGDTLTFSGVTNTGAILEEVVFV